MSYKLNIYMTHKLDGKLLDDFQLNTDFAKREKFHSGQKFHNQDPLLHLKSTKFNSSFILP